MALDLHDGFDASNGVPDLEEPIFTVERVQLQFSVAADFVAAQVANNVIVLALSNGRILRIDLERPEDIDGKGSEMLIRLFVVTNGVYSRQISTYLKSHPRSA